VQGFELGLPSGFEQSTENQNEFTQSNFVPDLESVFHTPQKSWLTSPTYISNFSSQTIDDFRAPVFFSETVPTDSSVLEEPFSTDSSENVSDFVTVQNDLNSQRVEEEEVEGVELTTMQTEFLPSPGNFFTMYFWSVLSSSLKQAFIPSIHSLHQNPPNSAWQSTNNF
jgi:hypothetical protein